MIISLLGMFMMGINFIYGLSIGAILAVLMTMLASVTLVPAIMGFAGTKLAAKEHKRRHHRETVAFRWSRQIQKRPVVMALASLAVLVVIALPMFSIRLGVADQGNDPTSLTTRRAYDLLAKGFGPGFNGPILLAADFTGTTNQDSVSRFADTVRADPDVAFVAPVQVNEAGNAAVVPVIPKGRRKTVQPRSLVHRLRAEIHQAGLSMHVGSVTAIAIDAADHVGARLPFMVAAVIVLSFLLLLAVFRSVLVAIKAGIMNLLSIGAAYGVIVAIFQWGWLRDVVGIGRPGPIEFWVPMMLFTVLFGLSMDYEVFLLSRVREEYLVSGDNATAVADGLAATARVITAAAAIMIAVFMSFVLGDLRVLKLLGLGLATAIFIDASIVRMVLVPATMELLGKANWWIPKWLDRILPRISTTLQIVGETLCETVDVEAGQRVLDVAAGNGNALARRGPARVRGDRLRLRVLAAGRHARPGRGEREGCASSPRSRRRSPALPRRQLRRRAVHVRCHVQRRTRNVPPPSSYGSAVPAAESASRTGRPPGFIGQMFKIVGRHVPPPAGVRSPLEWGTEPRLSELFGSDVEALNSQRRHFVFRYRSAQHWLDTFRTYYGPTLKAFAARLDDSNFDSEFEPRAPTLERDRSGDVRRTGAATLGTTFRRAPTRLRRGR